MAAKAGNAVPEANATATGADSAVSALAELISDATNIRRIPVVCPGEFDLYFNH